VSCLLSFSTSDDTKEYLSKSHADLINEPDVELLQNKSPKVDAKTLEPATFPEDPDQEWCVAGCYIFCSVCLELNLDSRSSVYKFIQCTGSIFEGCAHHRCPPGHGDIYPSLLGSGMLDRLIDAGIKYVFVSNSDNLGATLDVDLLAYFAETDKAFIMEVRLDTCCLSKTCLCCLMNMLASTCIQAVTSIEQLDCF